MMKPRNLMRAVSLLLCSLAVMFTSCEVSPQEIHYGSDACHYCKMTIVDSQHAAQLVTKKGKAFKYDAIECMLNHKANWDQAAVKFHLVADYNNPRILIDATTAHYLVSESIPSPMGAFLSAFENEPVREKVWAENGGKTLSWEQLLRDFKKQ